MSMKEMPAGEFKARCLTVMDDVNKTREPVLITKRGRPVAKLVPADRAEQDFIGRLEGRIRITGDIESPIEPPDAWEGLR
jgi:prevent-host-death family protein